MTTLRFAWIVAVVTMMTPVVVSLAKGEPEAPPVAAEPTLTELSAMAEACGLGKTYGLSVVAMPAPVGSVGSVDPVGHVDSVAPASDVVFVAAPVATCPEIRAIVAAEDRSDAFAIIAWDDTSFVVKPGSTVRAPFGDVTLQRLRSRSLAFVANGVALQCNLLVR